MKKILIVRTKAGNKYAEIIAQKINNLGAKCCGIVCWKELDAFLEQNECTPEKTLLYYRTTGRQINKKAHELKDKGYKIINSPEVLDRTSDKFYSYEWASKHGVDLPLTEKGTQDKMKHFISEGAMKEFVFKPVNSIGGGIFCFRSSINDPEIDDKLSQIPGEEIIVQEFVEYIRIYRVIIIGNKILDKAVFYDEPNPDRWKVSVCINPEMKLDENPDPDLLSYARRLADIFESEIGFIDIYETKDGYILSEINTACNLILHEQKSGYDISKDIAEYLVSGFKK